MGEGPADFAEIKALGANVVRVHLQLAKFMDTPTSPTRRISRGWVNWWGWLNARACTWT